MYFFSPREFLNSDGKYVFTVQLIFIIRHVCWERRQGMVVCATCLTQIYGFFFKEQEELGFGREKK